MHLDFYSMRLILIHFMDIFEVKNILKNTLIDFNRIYVHPMLLFNDF
jgi:hypothetical protein